MQFVVVVAFKRVQRFINEGFPQVDVIVLMFSRGIGLDERGGQLGLHA